MISICVIVAVVLLGAAWLVVRAVLHHRVRQTVAGMSESSVAESLEVKEPSTQNFSAGSESSDESLEKKPRFSYGKRVDVEVEREKLWERIETLMKEKEPYTSPDFDRSKLAKLLYSNSSYVSSAINEHGKNFSSWLAEYRVQKSISILEKAPKISVRELSILVGVNNPIVFNRQFHSIMGMSITEYRNSKFK